MTQYSFGAGAFWGNRSDTTGSGIGPDQFAVLQNISLDFGFDMRELHGQFQFPVDVARGKGKINGKAQFARVFAAIYGDLFFGITPTAGMTDISEDEVHTIPASSTFTITVTNASTFVDDLGVYYGTGANAGQRFTQVTTPSLAGQYAVNLTTGVYTFASVDASVGVKISYIYMLSTGFKITLTNQIMGIKPEFKGSFYTKKTTAGRTGEMAVVLNLCTSGALRLPTRLDDYTIQEFDFSAYADATGTIGTISTSE